MPASGIAERVIDQGFDDLDRLTARDITLGSGVGGDTAEDFAYDALGRLTEATDNDSTVQLTYDSLSRVSTEVQGSNPLGTTGKTVSYTWDAESNRTKIDYPSGFDANEARDALGRLTAITDGSSATVASFDLYGAGLREKKRTLANSTYTEVTYDGFRRPTDIDHKASGGTRFAGYAYRHRRRVAAAHGARSPSWGVSTRCIPSGASSDRPDHQPHDKEVARWRDCGGGTTRIGVNCSRCLRRSTRASTTWTA